MTSFQTGIKGNRKAAARLVRKVHRTIQKAYEQRKSSGVTQTSIANALDVHRSVISRQLRGTEDMSIGRIAEFAWALGYDVDLAFTEQPPTGGNHEPRRIPAITSTSATLHAEGGVDIDQLGIKVRTSGILVEPSVRKGETFKIRIDA
jgi:transcriptional regulator with XRE-family HTH domain